MWLASRFAAVWWIFSNIFRKNLITEQTSLESPFDKCWPGWLWLKNPIFILLHCNNSAPHGQAWKKLLSHQRYAGASFNPDYWSDYFPGLATSAGGQNLCRVSAFTPEMFRSFGSYAGVTFWCERGSSIPWYLKLDTMSCLQWRSTRKVINNQ